MMWNPEREAGVDLDAEIERRVFGFRIKEGPSTFDGNLFVIDPDPEHSPGAWHSRVRLPRAFSTSFDQAWLLWDWLWANRKDLGYGAKAVYLEQRQEWWEDEPTWKVGWIHDQDYGNPGSDDPEGLAEAPTAALALCRAALAALA